MKLSSCYRIRRSFNRGILSSLYTVNFIVITVTYLNTRSLQSSVSVKGLRDFFSILYTAYYKDADLNNAEFLCLIKTFLRSSVPVILM